MKFNRKTVSTVLLASTVLMTVGCSKDEEVVEPVAQSSTPTPTPTPTDPTYTVPSTYVFVDGSSASTVSFSGQQQRLEMLSELTSYMKTANTPGAAVSAQTLRDMYANANSFMWADDPGLGMNPTTKQLKSKTAVSGGSASPTVTAIFEAWMGDMASVSNGSMSNSTQSYGTGGVWTNGTKSYLQSAEGLEYTQLIEKGLMAAVFYSQMTTNYLANISTDDNSAIVDGKTYTEMQHHWDEAYGYFTSEIDYPTNGTNRFWGKYANGRESVLGSATAIATAFRTGRAAIDNNDYTARDAQAAIINMEMEKVLAGTAIHYLNDAKGSFGSENTLMNHQLSEAWAFLNGLRYGQPCIGGNGMSAANIDAALALIGTDFSAVTVANLDAAIDLIATNTGLDSVKASL
jgi:hypothetical protein